MIIDLFRMPIFATVGYLEFQYQSADNDDNIYHYYRAGSNVLLLNFGNPVPYHRKGNLKKIISFKADLIPMIHTLN